MEFWKMHGAGNDFIITDNRDGQISKVPDRLSEVAREVCQRHFGVGADGFMCVENSSVADIKMLYYNADGSLATMCGNGLRCFAKYVYDQAIVKAMSFAVETGDGIKQIEIINTDASSSLIRIDMGIWDGIIETSVVTALDRQFETTFLYLGVPHVVIFLDRKSTDAFEINQDFIRKYGPIIEKDPQFPQGANVNFVEVIDKSHERSSTWERGAGSTLACGTGACASAIASKIILSLSPDIEVIMPGGRLNVSIGENNRIFLEGPAQTICRGQIVNTTSDPGIGE